MKNKLFGITTVIVGLLFLAMMVVSYFKDDTQKGHVWFLAAVSCFALSVVSALVALDTDDYKHGRSRASWMERVAISVAGPSDTAHVFANHIQSAWFELGIKPERYAEDLIGFFVVTLCADLTECVDSGDGPSSVRVVGVLTESAGNILPKTFEETREAKDAGSAYELAFTGLSSRLVQEMGHRLQRVKMLAPDTVVIRVEVSVPKKKEEVR